MRRNNADAHAPKKGSGLRLTNKTRRFVPKAKYAPAVNEQPHAAPDYTDCDNVYTNDWNDSTAKNFTKMAYHAEGLDHCCHEQYDRLPRNIEVCPESSDDEEITAKTKSQSTIVMPSDNMAKFKYPLHGG